MGGHIISSTFRIPIMGFFCQSLPKMSKLVGIEASQLYEDALASVSSHCIYSSKWPGLNCTDSYWPGSNWLGANSTAPLRISCLFDVPSESLFEFDNILQDFMPIKSLAFNVQVTRMQASACENTSGQELKLSTTQLTFMPSLPSSPSLPSWGLQLLPSSPSLP